VSLRSLGARPRLGSVVLAIAIAAQPGVLCACGVGGDSGSLDGLDACRLLSVGQVQDVLRFDVLPPYHVESGELTCAWAAVESSVVDSGAGQPVVPSLTLTPGSVPSFASPVPPIAAPEAAPPPGVTLALVSDPDWPVLEQETESPSGVQTGRAVPGLGDEAVILAIGGAWRLLTVREGARTFDLSASRPGLSSDALEQAEIDLANLALQNI
jgi:hypothetical protein